jgi:teichuronic acid biosynthesis glycosyltransferase TuaH
MHTDWHWINQRPHFIASYLSKENFIFLTYPLSRNRKNLVKSIKAKFPKIPLILIPGWKSNQLIAWANILIGRLYYLLLIKITKPDFIWLTSPEFEKFLPKKTNCEKIIYDCMDDIIEFKTNAGHKSRLLIEEKDLLTRASLVICSSESLKEKLSSRYEINKNYIIIRNALHINSIWIEKSKKKSKSPVFGYIGTISEWIDWQLIIDILNFFEVIEIHLVGPIESEFGTILNHPRLKVLSPVPHSQLYEVANSFDALIMPFKTTELVKSVDPVKFYEYIYFNKPIISITYPEVQRFEPFIYFYTSEIEMISIINNLISNNFRTKYSATMRSDFINQNTWQQRADKIQLILNKISQSLEI